MLNGQARRNSPFAQGRESRRQCEVLSMCMTYTVEKPGGIETDQGRRLDHREGLRKAISKRSKM
jgi:hypothetical protein